MTFDEEELHKEILEYIKNWSRDPVMFDRLFRNLVMLQQLKNPLYDRFVKSTSNSIRSWREVPPIPVSFFKEFQLRSYEKHHEEYCWESSGTTGKKSRTYLSNSEVYDTVIRELWPSRFETYRGLSCRLIPNRLEWPHSSLSHFFSTGLRSEKYYTQQAHTYNFDTVTGKFQVDLPAVVDLLEECEDSGRELRLLGTSYAIASVFDHLEEIGVRFQLPVGSCIVDTGGYKGLVRDRSRKEFLGQASHLVGVPESECLNEYGMSELSSHFWSTRLYNWDPFNVEDPLYEEWWRVPPWVRVRAVDPITGEGQEGGVGVFYDLANVWSVAAIQTEDHIAIKRVHTTTYIRPLGRHIDADLKGCSITAERAMQ